MANIRTKIQLRNDTSANWQSANTLLLKGEFGFDTDNKYIKIGDGVTRWNDLSTVRLPKAAIDGLQDIDTNTIYQLSNITDMEFSLMSADGTLATPVWTVVSTFNAKDWTETIATVSAAAVAEAAAAADAKDAAVSALTKSEVIGQTTDLSTASTVYGAKEYANVLANAAKETAIATAAADATTKADNALIIAKAYTNSVSSVISTDVQTKYDDIIARIKDGIHFVGKVVEVGIDTEVTPNKGYYKKDAKGDKIYAKNGDLVIKDGIEYVYSEVDIEWVQLGDEGTWATKAYVDTAKSEAISATINTVQVVSAYEILTVGINTGDVGIVREPIGNTGKYQMTTYTWSAISSIWVPMDAYYSADTVIMPSNMTITEKFGKYDIPSTGSKELTCAGMTVKEFINDAFAQTRPATKTYPTFTFTTSNGTGEIGTKYTVPAATLKMTSVGSYQYGPDTGITVPVNNAVVKALKAGYEQTLSNNTAMALNSTVATAAGAANAETYLSGGATYSYHAEAYYTEGAVPKNNIGSDDPDNRISAGSYLPTDITATFTGYYPAYWAFTTSPKANPTALTANNGNVTVDGVTYTRELNSFGMTSFTTSSKWYELFYLVPVCKRNSSAWTGKDGNGVDLAVEAKTSATVTFIDGTSAAYNVYVVRNAGQYSATTCTMTFK